MPAYSVFINGRNFLTELEGSLKRLGFYTTREVEADDYAGAEAAAIDSLRASSKLRDSVRNAQDDPPQLFI